MKRLLLPMALMICGAAMGQKALTHYFPAGLQDGDALIKAYVRPMAEDLGSLSTNGWYNTGATHKRFGFDISATMNAVPIAADRTYFTQPTLSNTTYTHNPTNNAPTVY